ncbi:plasminogen-binding N-terminal domain-containing protein [Hydrogenimonas sp.]
MLRLFLVFLTFFAATLFAGTLPSQTAATLLETTGKEGVVNIGNLPKGMSGIVIHSFDDNHEAIVALATVTESEAGRSKVRFSPFTALSNPKLPTLKAEPQSGDRVILGYLYDRVLPIVPNGRSLKKAKESFGDLDFVHPDLFAVELASERDALPHRNNFQKICTKLHLGLVMFMFKEGTDFIDCVSWEKVAQSETGAAEGELTPPFYNRFGEIEPPFYDFSDYKLKNFDKFYKQVEKE